MALALLQGGDGGNRTRVRKIRPQISTSLVALFDCHRLGPHATGSPSGQPLAVGFVFHPTRGKLGGTPAFVTLGARAAEEARGQRVPILEGPALTRAGLGRERQARISEIASRYFGS
jgi:hypothetical protein